MSEVQRFVRYTYPALVSLLPLIIALCISDPYFKSKFVQLLTNKDVGGLGLLIAAFLTSGGLGYILSIIYFGLRWSRPFEKCLAPNHLPVFEFQGKSDFIVKDIQGKQVIVKTWRDAWVIVTQYLHMRRDPTNPIGKAEKITDRLVDIMHAHGATLIGTIMSFLIWIVIHLSHLKGNSLSGANCITMVVLWTAYIFLIYRAFRRTIQANDSIANALFIDDIKNRNPSGTPLTEIFYSAGS